MTVHRGLVGAFAVVYAGMLLDWDLPAIHAQSPVAYWTIDTAKFVALPGLMIWVARQSGELPSLHLEFRIGNYPRPLLVFTLAIVGCVVLLPMVWLVPKPLPWSYLWSSLNPNFDIARAIPAVGAAHYAALAYLALAPAVTEELFFRGILRSIVRAWTARSSVYIVASASLFASIHWENGSTVVENAFIYGLVAAWLFVRLGTLWPLIAGHFATNWIAFSH